MGKVDVHPNTIFKNVPFPLLLPILLIPCKKKKKKVCILIFSLVWLCDPLVSVGSGCRGEEGVLNNSHNVTGRLPCPSRWCFLLSPAAAAH